MSVGARQGQKCRIPRGWSYIAVGSELAAQRNPVSRKKPIVRM